MRKAIVGLSIFIFLLLTTVYLFKDSIAKWYLERQINQIEDFSEEFSYGDLHVASSGKQLHFTKIKYHSLKKDISFEADEIIFKGLSLYDLFQNNGLHVDSIFFIRPNISFDKTVQNKDSSESKEIKLKIGYLNIVDGGFTMILDSTENMNVGEFNFTALDISTTAGDTDFNFNYNAFEGSTAEFKFENSNNKINVNDILFSSDNQLSIAKVELKSKKVNARLSSETTTYFSDISMDILMDSLIRNQVILSDLVSIDSFYVEAGVHYYPVSNTSVRPKMPIELIRSLSPLKLVKQLAFKNGNIKYDGYKEKSDKLISIYFKQMEGVITGLGQLSETNKTANLKVESDFMNVCHMKANITFDLSSNNEDHNIVGEIKPFKLSRLNPLLNQIAPFQFKGGAINSFTFNIDLNEDYSSGVVNLLYDDLEITSIKKEDDSERGGFAIFLANTFVVRNNNPVNDKEVVKGEVDFERLKERSMFNYWWKSLFSGFKDVIIK